MSDAASPETEPTPIRPTGPRTECGKRRSRGNARVHGLTATLPDGAAEAALMQQFADRWIAQIGAETEAEEALIRSSAVAYARLERARKVEEATLRTGAQDAVNRWEKKKRHAVRRTAQELDRDPYNTVADLEGSSFGCEWLMRHWLKLDAKLAQGIAWDRHDLARAMTLQGLYPQAPGPDADPAIRRFWHLARLASGLPVDPMPGMTSDPVPARSELRRLIGSEFERLESLRNERWADRDGPEAESVAHAGLIDTSKDGQLRQRYRREAFSEMTRGINQVMRIRLERSKDDERQWRRAYPPSSRHRDFTVPKPGTMAEAVPASPTQPIRSADHRNEPPASVPEPAEYRLNPNNGNEMRQGSSADAGAGNRRTEPRFSASEPRPAAPLNDATPSDRATRWPSDNARRA